MKHQNNKVNEIKMKNKPNKIKTKTKMVRLDRIDGAYKQSRLQLLNYYIEPSNC